MHNFTKMILLILGVSGMSFADNHKKQLTLEDIYSSDQFKGKTVADVQWLPDGSAFTFTRYNAKSGERDIFRHAVKDGSEALILDGAALEIGDQKIQMTAYQTTGQQNVLLITGPRKQIWRHSYVAPYYLYDIDAKTLKPLAKGDPNLQNVTLSPNGKWVAFARDNNLFIADVAEGNAKALTKDGSFNILNGVFDWVYEEEFGRPDAYRWSPDSKHIAYWRTDQTRVKTFTLLDELPVYSVPSSLKYPKVGEQNAIVSIRVVNVKNGQTVEMDLGDNDDIYIPRIDWTNRDNTLSLQRLNRKQNHLELLLGNTKDGSTRTILNDKNAAWIDVTDDFRFLDQKEQFLWTSEKDGFRHIYLNNYDGKEIAQLTSGQWKYPLLLVWMKKMSGSIFTERKTAPQKDSSIALS